MLEIIRLQLRQLLGGRKFWLVVLFLGAPIVLTVVIRVWGDLPTNVTPDPRSLYLFALYTQALAILLALLYGASILSTDLEGKTLTYLFTRPLPKWTIVVGKYLGIVVFLAPATLASLLASWAALGAPGGPKYLLGLVACTGAAVLAYNALFCVFGVAFPRRALVVCLLYAGIFEFLVSFVPAVINMLTVNYYLRSLAVRIVGLEVPSQASRVVGNAPLGSAVAVLAGIVVATLAVASLVASTREYLIHEEA